MDGGDIDGGLVIDDDILGGSIGAALDVVFDAGILAERLARGDVPTSAVPGCKDAGASKISVGSGNIFDRSVAPS